MTGYPCVQDGDVSVVSKRRQILRQGDDVTVAFRVAPRSGQDDGVKQTTAQILPQGALMDCSWTGSQKSFEVSLILRTLDETEP